jgi:hypothetical protein
MNLQVFYTPRAKETLSSVYHFIYNKFGIRSADKFMLKSEKIIALIAEHPFLLRLHQLMNMLG